MTMIGGPGQDGNEDLDIVDDFEQEDEATELADLDTEEESTALDQQLEDELEYEDNH